MAKQNNPQSSDNDNVSGKERTSLYLRGDILKSIKLIALMEERKQTDIIDEALLDYIAKWEKKNGPVPKKA